MVKPIHLSPSTVMLLLYFNSILIKAVAGILSLETDAQRWTST